MVVTIPPCPAFGVPRLRGSDSPNGLGDPPSAWHGAGAIPGTIPGTPYLFRECIWCGIPRLPQQVAQRDGEEFVLQLHRLVSVVGEHGGDARGRSGRESAQAREVAFLPTRRRLGLDGNHLAAGLDHEVDFVAALLVPVGCRRACSSRCAISRDR